MLGLVIAGNIFMVFVFWELVGICSYFLIGFYIERKSASNAANKAFIVNRVGDFGMIIGLMAMWASLGTFAFGDRANDDGKVMPSAASSARCDRRRTITSCDTPEAWSAAAARPDRRNRPRSSERAESKRRTDPTGRSIGLGPTWRSAEEIWLLAVGHRRRGDFLRMRRQECAVSAARLAARRDGRPDAGLGAGALGDDGGCRRVSRRAVLPGVQPEVLLVIAYRRLRSRLSLAATIAITAIDIKRVLAYSTISQLGYMMLALGVGGWVAGMFHLITHAFFKSLLFLCSGSVIHATHTNEMPRMGGLRHKMPWTAYTMLVGCLAIIGGAIPFLIGFSGYYSKDAIIAQALSFCRPIRRTVRLSYSSPPAGRRITAFYMFRLWYHDIRRQAARSSCL